MVYSWLSEVQKVIIVAAITIPMYWWVINVFPSLHGCNGRVGQEFVTQCAWRLGFSCYNVPGFWFPTVMLPTSPEYDVIILSFHTLLIFVSFYMGNDQEVIALNDQLKFYRTIFIAIYWIVGSKIVLFHFIVVLFFVLFKNTVLVHIWFGVRIVFVCLLVLEFVESLNNSNAPKSTMMVIMAAVAEVVARAPISTRAVAAAVVVKGSTSHQQLLIDNLNGTRSDDCHVVA